MACFDKCFDGIDKLCCPEVPCIFYPIKFTVIAGCCCPCLLVANCIDRCGSKNDTTRIKKKDEALIAVRCNGLKLEDCSDELQSDREVVLAAVSNNGLALSFADKPFAQVKLKADREIALAAVQNNGLALKYVNDARRQERYICMAAVKNVSTYSRVAHP